MAKLLTFCLAIALGGASAATSSDKADIEAFLKAHLPTGGTVGDNSVGDDALEAAILSTGLGMGAYFELFEATAGQGLSGTGEAGTACILSLGAC